MTLTRDDIETIRRTGRDEVARSTTIGLAELDALCDMALQTLPTEPNRPLTNTEVYDKLDTTIKQIHEVEGELTRRQIPANEFRQMLEFTAFRQYSASLFTTWLQPRRRTTPQSATVGSVVVTTSGSNIHIGTAHSKNAVQIQAADFDDLMTALRGAIYD